MKLLFELIERIIRGEYDSQMRQEHILTVIMDLEEAEEDAEEELMEAGGLEFMLLFQHDLYLIGEDYDAGTDETIAEYKSRVAELYERAKKMLEEKRADGQRKRL